ncbi:MAG TPA: hypothetical protein VL404_03980 [Candidatus Eisenbacteria bacterium]|nr:hypothetical protein [Candidatus Eisenbacteria bacterium]
MIGAARDASAEELYDAHGKRDPFVPLVTLTSRESSGLMGIESAGDINIEGIVYDPRGSVVVLNGSVLKEGEEMGSLKVVKIEPNGVRVLINGTESYISLYNNEESKGKTHR